MLDYGECPEAVHFQFVNPIRIIERSGPLLKRHWLENLHGCKQNTKWDELLSSMYVRLNPIIGYANLCTKQTLWDHSAACVGFTKPLCVENQITEIAGEIILKEIDQVLRCKELELSQVEIEVQSLRIVAELLGENADREEARKPGVFDTC